MEVVWRRVAVVVINSLFSKSLPGAREERILSSHSAPAMTGGTSEGTGLSRTLHKDRKWKGDKWGEK